MGLHVLSVVAAVALLAGCVSTGDRATVTVACAGDVMLGRGVAEVCETRGNDYPFAGLRGVLASAELTFANLETPLTHRRKIAPRINALRASPQMAGALQRAGFDVLGLANNHMIDCGREGLLDTLAALRGEGISPVGAGATLQEAEQGAVITVNGVRAGFQAYSRFPEATFVHDPGRASLLLLSEESLRRTIPPLKGRCDALVVGFHWGKEGVAKTSPSERGLAHLATDLGADVVVGHHAHVRGEIEPLGRSLIAYCLGNLVFDEQSYGGNEGLILTCTLGRGGLRGYSVTPVKLGTVTY